MDEDESGYGTDPETMIPAGGPSSPPPVPGKDPRATTIRQKYIDLVDFMEEHLGLQNFPDHNEVGVDMSADVVMGWLLEMIQRLNLPATRAHIQGILAPQDVLQRAAILKRVMNDLDDLFIHSYLAKVRTEDINRQFRHEKQEFDEFSTQAMAGALMNHLSPEVMNNLIPTANIGSRVVAWYFSGTA